MTVSKLFQENKQKRPKYLQCDYKYSMEPVSLSMIMYMDDETPKTKKSKIKDIQGFLKFQSQRV